MTELKTNALRPLQPGLVCRTDGIHIRLPGQILSEECECWIEQDGFQSQRVKARGNGYTDIGLEGFELGRTIRVVRDGVPLLEVEVPGILFFQDADDETDCIRPVPVPRGRSMAVMNDGCPLEAVIRSLCGLDRSMTIGRQRYVCMETADDATAPDIVGMLLGTDRRMLNREQGHTEKTADDSGTPDSPMDVLEGIWDVIGMKNGRMTGDRRPDPEDGLLSILRNVFGIRGENPVHESEPCPQEGPANLHPETGIKPADDVQAEPNLGGQKDDREFVERVTMILNELLATLTSLAYGPDTDEAERNRIVKDLGTRLECNIGGSTELITYRGGDRITPGDLETERVDIRGSSVSGCGLPEVSRLVRLGLMTDGIGDGPGIRIPARVLTRDGRRRHDTRRTVKTDSNEKTGDDRDE